jgi:hypothetical protein
MAQYSDSQTFSPRAEGLGGTLNYFPAYCLTSVMRCAIDAKHENKEVCTVHNLYKFLGTSVLHGYVFFILFHNLFLVIPIVRQNN